MMRLITWLFVILLFTSCDKDRKDLPYSVINLPSDADVFDVCFPGDSLMIVTGNSHDQGVIFRLDNSGWNILNFPNTITCTGFANEQLGFCGDNDILIYKTTDGGMSWQQYYDSQWPLTVNRNLRDIALPGDSSVIICGGKNYGNGVRYISHSSGQSWQFDEYTHEYRSIAFNKAGTVLMGGYGSLLRSADSGNMFISSGEDGYFYTGISTDVQDYFWICDFNGSIFRCDPQGKNLYRMRKGNAWSTSAGQLNTIAISSTGIIACAGPSGYLLLSRDEGQSWEEMESFGGDDIRRLRWKEDMLYACGKKGLYTAQLR